MTHKLRYAGWLAAFAGAAILAGCGGGGAHETQLTGMVTNPEGKAVTGAFVSAGSSQATSLANGTFILHGVPEGYRLVQATATISGYRYSGETWVDVARQQNSTVNVMVSDERYQGGITGRVIGPEGFGLAHAKVFLMGRYSSVMSITRDDGSYQFDRLDSDYTYSLSASLAGYLNDTRTNVSVPQGDYSTVSFALAYGSAQGPLPAPTGVSAQAWTLPSTVTRASGPSSGPYRWLQQVYRQRRGLPLEPRSRSVERLSTGRAAPAGSVVEVDLFWTYADFNDLLGYAVSRGTSSSGPMPVVSVLRDPLSSAFFDDDAVLTPEVVYYYTIARLDTITFPETGETGPASTQVSAQPFAPIHALNPLQGEDVGGSPVFHWSSVPGATAYQIIVWDRFPALEDETDPNSARRVWPVDLNNPGTSLVSASTTTQPYGGPALQPGKTYYWMVIATDQGGYSLSASEIRKFID